MGGCGLQLCRSEPVIKGYQAEKVHAETLEEKWGSRVGGTGTGCSARLDYTSSLSLWQEGVV